MRQGLVLLALLGAAIGLETLLPPDWPGWVGSLITMAERGLFALVILVLLVSLVQRAIQIAHTARESGQPLGMMRRLLLTTPHGPFLVLHGGLALLIAAFGYAKSGAIEAVMELPVGSESREARLDDGQRMTLPFTVRATAFDTEHYPTGEIKQFVGEVSLLDGEDVVASQALGVGAPLDYRGYRFSLFRYGYLGSRVTGSVRAVADFSRATPYEAQVGQDVAATEGSGIRLTTLVDQATRRTPSGEQNVGRSLVYEVQGRDGHRYEVMSFQSVSHVVDYRKLGDRDFESIHLLRDRARAKALPFDHYLTVTSVEPAKTIGLQIRFYPGLGFLLASATLVVLGVTWMLQFWKPVASRSESTQTVLLTPSPRTPPPTFILPRKGGGTASPQVIEGTR